jgi:hypothetical protein
MKLIKRSEEQSDGETLHVRQVSRHHLLRKLLILIVTSQATRLRHPSQTDVLFAKPLALLRSHCVAYTVHKSYGEMEFSVFYLGRRFLHLRDMIPGYMHDPRMLDQGLMNFRS